MPETTRDALDARIRAARELAESKGWALLAEFMRCERSRLLDTALCPMGEWDRGRVAGNVLQIDAVLGWPAAEEKACSRTLENMRPKEKD